MWRSATLRKVWLVVAAVALAVLAPPVAAQAPGAGVCDEQFDHPERRARCRYVHETATTPPDAEETAGRWIEDATRLADSLLDGIQRKADDAAGDVQGFGSDDVEDALGDAKECRPPETLEETIEELVPSGPLDLHDEGGDGGSDGGPDCPLTDGSPSDPGKGLTTVGSDASTDGLWTGSRSPTSAPSTPDRPDVRVARADPGRVAVPGGDAILWSVALLAAAVPLWLLYRRLTGDQLLDHETRREILQALEDDPGQTTADLASDLGVHYETARHHLDLLVEFGHAVRRRDGQALRHFPNHGALQPEEMTLAAKIRDPTRREVLETLVRRGPTTTSRLADRIGVAKSTVSHHLGELADAGIVDRERDGRSVLYGLETGVEERLLKLV